MVGPATRGAPQGRRTRVHLGPPGTCRDAGGGRRQRFGYARPMPGRDAPGDGDRRLIEAGMVLASELSLDAVLQRIVELAVDLTGARYGALGVLTPDGRSIQDFITVGITPEERAALGDPPIGHGLLGALTREARPLRIPDIARRPALGGVPAEPPADDVAPRGSDHRARDRVREHLPHRQAGRRDVRRGGRTRPRGPRDPGRDRRRERAPLRRDRTQGQGAPAAAGARGAGADREGAPRRRHPIAVRGRDEPAGPRVVIGRRGDRARASRRPSRMSMARSGTCATTSSVCARGSWPTGSSTRRSRRWRPSSEHAPAS